MRNPKYLAAIAGLFWLGCQKQVPEKVDEPARPLASVVPQASAEPAPSPTPPSQPGEWVESLRYKLRVHDITPCDDPPGPNEKAASPFRLGVTVEVQATEEAKVSAVVASPAAATLEKGGQVFRAIARPIPTEACKDVLGHEQVKPGASARGTLIFEAPNESYFLSSILAFKPPRWGGEARVEVRMPDCFGKSCPDAKPAPAGSAPSASR